jgi:N-acetylneuraminic acid mutarotase
VAINGIIYLAGGHDAAGALTRTLYAYNTTTNTWSTKANMPIFSSCGGSAAYAGKLYVYTGCTRSSTGAQVATARLHRYDPSTNAWTSLRSAPASHFQPVVGVISGRLYVVGGNLAGTGTSTGRLDMYNPATNRWSTRPRMPTPRVAAAGLAIAGKLHVIGGRNGATYLGTVEAYDPLSDSWTTRSTMPTARAALGVGGLGGFLYAVGGRNSTRVLARNERYTP